MNDDDSPKAPSFPPSEGAASFPPASSKSPFRVPASRPQPAALSTPVVVSRPEPPVAEVERPSSPTRPPPKPKPGISPAAGFLIEPRPSRPFVAFLAEHPRLGGLVVFVGFSGAALYLASRIAHPGHFISRSRALQPVFMHASAALAFAGLWFLLVEVPLGEKDDIPTWWKLGLAAFAVAGAALVKPITGLVV